MDTEFINIRMWGLCFFVLALSLIAKRFFLLVIATAIGSLFSYHLISKIGFDLNRYRINYFEYLREIGFLKSIQINIFLFILIGIPIIQWYNKTSQILEHNFGNTLHGVLLEFISDSERIRKTFHGGALLIDQASKWFIIFGLVTWLFWQRSSDEISNSWKTLTQAHGHKAELGRIEALEVLNDNSKRLNLLDLSDIDLAGLDVGFQFDEQKKAQLNGVDLSSSYLSDSNFSGARLHNSNFEKSYIYGVDFSFSDLRNAKMKGAFTGEFKFIDSFTSFVGADLRNADLTDHQGGWKWITENYDPYRGEYTLYMTKKSACC